MKYPRKALVATLAVAALALAGCSSSGDDEKKDSGDDATLASVDTMYGEVEIPKPEDGDLTVVALGWSDAEIALALDVKPVALNDWQGFGEENKGVGSWATDLFGDEKPTIFANPNDGLDYEAIQELDPDLILNTRSAADEKAYDRLSSIAPTVYAPKDTADFGTKWDVQTQLIADALGKSDEGKKLVEEVQTGIDEAASEHPEFKDVTAVSATKFGDAYGAYISGDARWDLVEGLGFKQNPAVLKLTATGFYAPVTVEQISALDAEVAVMFPIGYTLEQMEADPLISSLKVVQDKHTVFLDASSEGAQAFSAASPLSIPIATEAIVPELSEILAK